MAEGIKKRAEKVILSPEEKKAAALRREMGRRKETYEGERARGVRASSYLYEDLIKSLTRAKRMPEFPSREALINDAYDVIMDCLDSELDDARPFIQSSQKEAKFRVQIFDDHLKFIQSSELKQVGPIPNATNVAENLSVPLPEGRLAVLMEKRDALMKDIEEVQKPIE